MNGLSVEPGERSACVMSTWPARRVVEIIRRADAGEHFAGRVVDHEDRDREVGAERARPLARQFLEALLQASRRWSSRCTCCVRRGRDRPDRRHAAPASASAGARPATVSRLAQRDLVGRNDARRGDAVEHAVARARAAARSGRAGAAPAIAAAPPAAPPRPASAARLLAEIGERRGADAFEIAAIGREGQIERQGSRPCSELRSISMARTIWRSLAPRVRSAARLQQPRHLHGQGRAAGDDAAAAERIARPRAAAPADRRRDASRKRRSS